MKNLLIATLIMAAAARLCAQSSTSSYPSDQPITIPTSSYDIRFSVAWFSDDYPMNSAPGRIDLVQGATLVGRVVASDYRGSGPSISVSGGGTVDDVSSTIHIYTTSGTPGDGFLYGTWHLTGLTPGDYTIRAWTYRTADRLYEASTVWTDTSYEDGWSPVPANRAPTIAWTVAPASAAHGENYYVSARGHDDDGNLAQVNVWKDGVPFAFAGGGNGSDGDSGNTTNDTGPRTVTFTAQAVDGSGLASPVITHVVTVNGPANTPPSVTFLSPGSQTVTAGTMLTVSARATDPDGNISGHNLDIQRPAGDWNWQGGFATGEPYQGGPVGGGADSTRSANFTFSDVGTYYLRSAAYDGSGWHVSGTVAITVVAPPTVQFSLSTNAGPGGSVSPGGTFDAGTTATVVATPDAYHDFAGWSGDAGGMVNPAGLLMDRNKTVQANFSWKQFALTTSATSGGSVTAGGSYPYGSVVTLTATPEPTARFTGWSGGATGTATTTVVTITGPLAVQAVFVPKSTQTIAFTNPGSRSVGAPPFPLDATSSAGLPVTFTVLSGPAMYSEGQLRIVGPGSVTVQASQAGDAFYLPAPSVTQTFNSVAPVVVRYRGAARTVLQSRTGEGTANLVLENP
jgi:hypothetical protein